LEKALVCFRVGDMYMVLKKGVETTSARVKAAADIDFPT
jgi:hypothetical protein